MNLDGLSVGVLKNGESLAVHTSPGTHLLSFLKNGKQEKSVSLSIGQEEYVTNLSVRLNGRQKIEVSMSSNGNLIQNDALRSKKKNGIPLVGRIVIAIFAVIILIGALFGSNPSEKPSNPTETDAVELTDEEKAEAQLGKATEKFQNGNYMDAINLCNEILLEYPNTDIATNMDSYLDGQFAQYPRYSAKELMSEYDANIVNADEKYTDVVMVVSGTVNSIAKTNNDKNLAVILESGTYFYGVQLNFKTSQVDAVATLSKGDKITVVGKCTGKSGAQFIVFEGNNVMISNCYLIEP